MKDSNVKTYPPHHFEEPAMNILKRFFVWLAQAAIGLAFMAFIVLMIAEWAAGCGESYVDAKGKTHINQCLFIKK